MKNQLILTLALIAFTAQAGTVTVSPSKNLVRNAGQDFPVTFFASGWPEDQVAHIWLQHTRYGHEELVFIDAPIQNGLNTVEVGIGWSWWETGYWRPVVHIGDVQAVAPWQVRLRTAIIWPYGGTVYPKDSDVWVTWTTNSYINADFLVVTLHNESIGEGVDEWIEVATNVDPTAGRVLWHTPNITGNRFRIYIDGYFVIEEDGWPFFDWSESTQSERVSIQ